MKKTLIILLPFLMSLQVFAQKIEIIKNDKGFKEIDFTKPNFNLKAEPVPKANGTYQMTHLMEVVCDDNTTGESGTIVQYINITNGVVGITSDLLKTMGREQRIRRRDRKFALLGNLTYYDPTNVYHHP